jgi:cardiolipin hydrolase
MNPERLKNMLRQTLDDFRLSRGEQTALRQIIGHLEPTEHQWALYRSVAFELAREHLDGSNASELVDWLEAVNRVLVPSGNQSDREVRSEAYFSPADDCAQQLAGMFRSTRDTVDVCVFTITDDRVSEAIIEAHRRGVTVRVISDDEKAFDPGSDIMRLEQAGVPVRVDRTRYHMHHKFALFDRQRLVTGSYNWTRSANDYNEENFIVTGDARLVDRFSKVFSELWQQFG